jgi:hypothetical protein
MTRVKLTQTLRNARAVPSRVVARGMGVKAMAALTGMTVLLSGCINIQAPDKPIVIQLDINIRAEVLYALAEDAANTIDENADIF